jgi:hypothetical protein
MKPGSLSFLELSGSVQACGGVVVLYLINQYGSWCTGRNGHTKKSTKYKPVWILVYRKEWAHEEKHQI